MKIYDEKTRAALRFIADNFAKFIQNLSEEGDLEQLKKYFPSDSESELNKWNIEKTKTVLELLRSSNKYDVQKVLSFLEHSELGWHINRYWLANRSSMSCGINCKKLHRFTSREEAEKTSNHLRYIST